MTGRPDSKLAKSRLEALLTMATGAVAQPVAGLAGLYGTLTGGAAQGARNVDRTQQALTYAPRDPRGLQELTGALAPITDRLEAGKRYLGDKTLAHTGSPLLATGAYMVPDTLLTLLGARGAGVKGPSLAQMVERSAMPTGPARQLGIFAGKGAKTADLNAMAVAQSRLELGADPRAVWRDTGWMKGPDGQMRFEIDDSGSRFNSEPLAAPLNEALVHPDLHAAYDLGDVAVTIDPRARYGGSYDTRGGEQFMEVNGPQADHRSIALHETQHAIQNAEGFARGGSTRTAPAHSQGVLSNLEQQLEAARAAGDRAAYYKVSDAIADLQRPDGFGAYRRLAGEAEARAVQKRMDYTPQQRRDFYPLDDYDVPLDELILRGGNGPALSIDAWHGSPHDFDAFDLSKIGTGEGAQAYGHGLYFSGDPTVARTYQSKVSAMHGGPRPSIEGRPINWDDPREVAAFELHRHGGNREAAAAFHEATFRGSDVPAIIRSGADLPEVQPPGRLYNVELAPDETDLLDWDAPLSQQPEKVRAALEKGFGRHPTRGPAIRGESPAHMEYTGRGLYEGLAQQIGGQDAATEVLRNLGIPGLRYLDGGSRAAGDGSRNYVIFDDSLVKIRGKR